MAGNLRIVGFAGIMGTRDEIIPEGTVQLQKSVATVAAPSDDDKRAAEPKPKPTAPTSGRAGSR